MVKNGVNPFKSDLLPPNFLGFWDFYHKKSPGRGLQRLLVAKMESQLAADQMKRSDSSPQEKSRLRSIKGKHAGAWLTTLPLSPMLNLSDAHFRVACRLRLGLPPQDNLPPTCQCGLNLKSDPLHFLSCKRIKRSAVTQRHNMVLQRLSHLLQQAGGSVYIEPNWFEGKRPDAQVNFSRGNTMIDVSITHPSAPSLCRSAAARPLAAAKRRENLKECKYSSIARDEECQFVPFVMESYGSLGKQAFKFLKKSVITQTTPPS